MSNAEDVITIMEPIHEIMLVKLRTLGDVLTTFPLIRALKERFPEANLTVVADEMYEPLFTHHSRIDAFWGHPVKALKAGGSWANLKHHQQMVRAIKKSKIDLYVDLYGSMRTALWGALAGVPNRIGFNLRGRKYFYHHQVVAKHRYVVDINLQFAKMLGWQGMDNRLEFFISQEDREAAKKVMIDYGWKSKLPYLVVSPGGGWPLKCWDATRFGRIVNVIQKETGCQIVVSGSGGEKKLIEACQAQIEGSSVAAIDLPLRQVAAIISGCRLFLGNDSGPKYFAEAYNVPTLICYGPTDFINNNPSTPINVAAHLDIPCRPCHSEVCQKEKRICLDELSEKDVLRYAFQLWTMSRGKESL